MLDGIKWKRLLFRLLLFKTKEVEVVVVVYVLLKLPHWGCGEIQPTSGRLGFGAGITGFVTDLLFVVCVKIMTKASRMEGVEIWG
ncbi:uncharacterized protein BO87DRAFT_373614, partial [Aspergillus neoniger CBS 115656]